MDVQCRMWLKCPWDDRRFVRHLGNVSLISINDSIGELPMLFQTAGGSDLRTVGVGSCAATLEGSVWVTSQRNLLLPLLGTEINTPVLARGRKL